MRLPKLSASLAVAVLAMGYATSALAQSSCDQFATFQVAGGSYIVQNNFFNPQNGGSQCLSVDPNSGDFTVTGNNNTGGGGAPGGYPSIYKGCHWGGCTANSGLPIAANQIQNVNTSWNTKPAGAGNWDVSYDIWFNQTPATSGQPNGLEIMVWINHGGSVTPAGQKTGNVTLNGINFDVWTAPLGSAGFNSVWNIVSYVATTPRNSVNFDLKPFFDDSQSRGLLNPNWYLLDVEAGFEGWQNWSGESSSGFSVSVNSHPTQPDIDPNAWYEIVGQHSGACWDDANFGTYNGSVLQIWSCNTNGQANQQWQFTPTDSGYYQITSRQAPLSVDVKQWGTANQSPLQLWQYGGGTNQQWQPVKLGDGTYKFVGRASQRCIDVPSDQTANGTALQLYDCNGTDAQAWQLKKVN